MNFPKKALLGSLLLISATSAFAVDTAPLTVIGTIAPTACTPTFAGGGVVDYGLIPTASLSTTANTTLPSRPISYTIHCDAPISIGTGWADNRSGSAIDDPSYNGYQSFGLGKQGTANIGAYTVSQDAAGATGDGTAVDLVYRDNAANGWTAVPATGVRMYNGLLPRVVAYAPAGTVAPGAYSDFAATLTVIATVAPTSTLDLTTSVTLDGLSTMTVNYL